MSREAGRLRVGVVAPLWSAIPPRAYGGIERHVALLVDELVRRGHSVTLFATGDSRTRAELRPAVETAVAEAMDRGEAFSYEHYLNACVADALGSAADFDLMHFHVGLAAVPLAELAGVPVLHTVHSGITRDDVWILGRHAGAAVTALSHGQLAPVPVVRRRSMRVVPYGFDFDTCVAAAGPPEHLVFLGRMAEHKGPDEAIRIARAAGRPIVLAGEPVTQPERSWFERHVRPLIDGRDVRWLGAVGDSEKDALFRSAIALVFPLRWEEPFGLVMLEALARGVPVLAVRRGAVPEVVEPGRTGWYEPTADALAGFVDAAARLDRGAVRDRARRRFSRERMADGYLEAYASLVGSRGSGRPRQPRAEHLNAAGPPGWRHE